MWNKPLAGILLLLAISLYACKKENNSTITLAGTISDSTTGAIGGANIQFSVKEISGGTFSSIFQTYYSGTSASDGTYTHTFDAHNALEYKIEITSENRFDQEYIINPDDLERNATNTFNFSLIPQSWYRVNIRNTSPYDSTDLIQYQIASSQLSCPGCCHNLIQLFDGDLVDTTFKCMTTGNSMLKTSWNVTKNGFLMPFSDSVYCSTGDTAVMNINY